MTTVKNGCKSLSRNEGIAYAYILVAAAALAIVTALGVSMAQSFALPATTIANVAATRSSMVTGAMALAKVTTDGGDSVPVPPAGSMSNGDGYDIPITSGAGQADAWGVKFRYCVWDHGRQSSAGRIVGEANPAADALLFAIMSAGTDKTFSTSCANLKAGLTNGDDLAVWKTISDYRRDGVGSSWLLDAVDCESASSPVTDIVNAASGCATSTSRLDLMNTAQVKEGQQMLVRKAGKLMAWQGGAWRQIGGAGTGNYPAPTPFDFINLTGQACGSTVTSAAVQINGISVGTPLTIQGGLYATSTDNVSYSAYTNAVTTIGPGTWVRLRVTNTSTPNAVKTVVLNIGGTEKTWRSTNGACSCPLPWGGTIAEGSSVTAYATTRVPYGSSCSSQTRTCSAGVLSGSYTNSYCSPDPGASCNLPWGGSVSDGSWVYAYSTPSGSSCNGEWRSCSNGYLSGSYQYQSCSVVSYTWKWSSGPTYKGQATYGFCGSSLNNPSGQPCSPPGATKGPLIYCTGPHRTSQTPYDYYQGTLTCS